MPYIKQSRRDKLDPLLDQLGEKIESEGELNYAFTRLALLFVRRLKGKSYMVLNTVIGAFESAKLEFYRRSVAPYEDDKRKENGDVEA